MIKKLSSWQEIMESDRVISTAFLDNWNEEKSRQQSKKKEEAPDPDEERWGLYDERGNMVTSFIAGPTRLSYDGQIIDCGEGHMIGSLPEARSHGNVRKLLHYVMEEFRSRGDVFCEFVPFSFSFYRQFGFELVARNMSQKFSIDQLKDFKCTMQVKQVLSQRDTDIARKLYETFILDRNFAYLRQDKDWTYRGSGEFGERDWFNKDKQVYTYLFYDDGGKARGYLSYFFEPGPEGPFTGTMKVTDMVYDSPETFRNILGFCYGLRAKMLDVELVLMDDLDLALVLPECSEKIQRKVEGHITGRVLNVEKALSLMKQPQGSGSYSVMVTDAFMTENTGSYQVSYQDGKAVSVEKSDDTTKTADLEVDETTLVQLLVGRADLEEAEYRTGTKVNANRKTLEKAFVHKTICIR